MSQEQPETVAAESESQSKKKPSLRRRIGLLLLIVVILCAAFLVAAPSPIEPVAYEAPPTMKLTGPLESNDLLRSAEILAKGKIHGPEDVDVDTEGRIYGATIDGKIARILTDGSVETFVETGGRPLGIDFDASGNLIVCDADLGLLSVDPDGNITTLATEADAVRFGFTDDPDVASDGTIYFSDASSKFGTEEYILDLFEGQPHGRLISYLPQTKQTNVLLDGLYFANGVAISPDEDFVLVNETYRYRITRYWLKGEKAGTSDIFIDSLPGFPDGVSTSPRGTFWVAMFTVRNETSDFLAPYPFMRSVLAKLPAAFWPKPESYGLILELNTHGDIIRSLHDPGGRHVSVITSVHEQDGSLYLGSLLNDWVARYELPSQ